MDEITRRFKDKIGEHSWEDFSKLGGDIKEILITILEGGGKLEFIEAIKINGSFRLTFLTVDEFTFDRNQEFSFPYLKRLAIGDCRLGEPRIRAPSLKELFIRDSEISDPEKLSFLSDLKSVERIDLNRCKIRSLTTDAFDLSFLTDLRSLKSLEFDSCGLTSIPFIQNLPHLETMRLSHNRLTSLESLRNIRDCDNLKEINLQYNRITDLCGLEPLAHLKSVETLWLNENRIKELHITATLPFLQRLYVNDNEITSVSGLERLTAISGISLKNNKIRDLAYLQPDHDAPNIRRIKFAGNKISTLDFSALRHFPHLEHLDFLANRIMDLAGLDALPHKTVVTGFELEVIDIDAFPRMRDYARSCEWALDGYHDPKPGNLYYDGPILVHTINELLEIRLYAPKRVEIFVDGKQFVQCKFLIFSLDLENAETAIGARQVQSIDEAEHFFARVHSDKREFENHSRRIATALNPEETFRAHASNLQAWAENQYDTRLLHRNLAFPLLKRLTEAGDPVALHIFKEEIARRYASGHPTVQKFLKKEGYLNHLSEKELKSLN